MYYYGLNFVITVAMVTADSNISWPADAASVSASGCRHGNAPRGGLLSAIPTGTSYFTVDYGRDRNYRYG